MKRRGTLLLVLVLGLAGMALAQAATALVTGEVFYNNNKPAVSCTVTIAGKYDFVDNNGRFRLFDVPTGNHTLSVACDKKVLTQVTVTVRAPKVTLPKIVLSR